jgi:hypothetical protein
MHFTRPASSRTNPEQLVESAIPESFRKTFTQSFSSPDEDHLSVRAQRHEQQQ